ncbi:MAG: 50S ribosomal protein L10 [Planctomycetales bacterium]|nr:50S ribosomal protein L10 [Planctomycetales bacterium]NIP85035.1 50S ribosomal protein L10 [Planctomycetales bacterium]
MSKYLKNLISDDLATRLEGIQDALLVKVIGLDANRTMTLRRTLREKDIHLLVVKNSLAQRATAGTPLHAAFQEVEGPVAIVWGSDDIVSLSKEIVGLSREKLYEGFVPRGGVMDGESLTPEEVEQVSKWPSREEQLSLLVGQMLGPGAQLAAQLLGPGGALASQIAQRAEEDGQAA